MSNTIKPMDHGMLNKLGHKSGGAREVQSSDRAAQTRDNPDAVGKPAGDTVELTSGAQLLGRLEQTLASLPDMDPARIAAVKTAIASGDYTIDAEKIADALLRSSQELGG